MNIKGNLKYIIIGSVVFLFIYMFIAAIPMGNDIYFEPIWTADISADTVTQESISGRSDIEAFILANRYGYFTPDGTILSSSMFTYRVTASSDSWAVYPQNARDVPVYFPDNTLKMTIHEAGFLQIDEKRTYLFLPGGTAVSRYSDAGKALWKKEHTAPISAFNSSQQATVIGYADGMLSCVQADGNESFSFYPGGSDYQVILGSAVSKDGTLVACVAGIDKQRFLLIRITGNQYKIIYHMYLAGNLRRQTFVDFEETGNFAFFETETGIGIIDCKKLEARFIPLKGKIISAGEYPGKALFVMLLQDNDLFTLAAIERPDHLVASAQFKAKNAFLVQREQAIYLGTDTRISRIDIRGLQ